MRRPVQLLASLAIAVTGIACSGPDEPPVCDAPEATSSIEIVDFDFAPTCVEAAAGSTLQIDNTGAAPHTFTVSDTDLDLDLPAGEAGELALEGVVVGTTYMVHCTYHPDMHAALKIV
jgi:plastocyanin